MKTKADRAKVINDIIKEIGSRGRNFFKHNSNFAEVIIKNNRVYMINEWNGSVMPLQTRHDMQPKNWHHGGTLWGLTKDFRDFINFGGDTNHNHGYGGLYCQHWGYSEKDMQTIRDKAKELGYLK